MHNIRTTSRTTFAPGQVLHLSAAQAGIRAHNLEELGEGRYRVINEIEFRQDEELGFEGDLTAAHLQVMEVYEMTLEDMDQPELLAMAIELGCTPRPHPNTGPAKLLEAIKARQDEMLAEQEAAEKAEAEAAAKAARIADLEARLDTLTEAELAELEALTKPQS
jgi:hypothetical protein